MTKLERIIITSPPAAFLIRKSKKWTFPGSASIPLYDVFIFFQQQVKKVGLNERAAAISFNLIMALPAALLFLFSIVPYMPASERFQRQLLRLFNDISPTSETSLFIRSMVDALFEKHVGVFSLGFVLLVFYASNAMMGVIRTFDKSIKDNKGYFFHRRLRAIRLTFILLIVVIASIVLLLGQQQLRGLFNIPRRTYVPWWNGVRWSIIVCLVFFSISFIYKYAPSIKKRWSLVSPGSLLATVLMLVTAILFSYWVNNFAAYNKVYGSIGTVLIIMLLIYINSLILLIGFELNVSITYLTRQAEAKKLTEITDPG